MLRSMASRFLMLLALLALLPGGNALGQGQGFQDQFGLGGQGGGLGGEVITANGYFTVTPDGKFGRLYIEAKAQANWHFYATTQGPGGPLPAKLKVTEAGGFKITGDFKAHNKPDVHPDESFGGLMVEEFHEALWSAPLEFVEGTDTKKLTIDGAVNAQACQTMGSCLAPEDYKFKASFKTLAEDENAGKFKPEFSEMNWLGHVSRQSVPPAGTVEVSLTARVNPGWHIYELGEEPSTELGPQPTLIHMQDLPEGWKSSIKASKQAVAPENGSQAYYEDEVTFTITVDVPVDTKPGVYTLSGLIAFATCNDHTCTPPEGLAFSRDIVVDQTALDEIAPVTFRAIDNAEVMKSYKPSRLHTEKVLPPAPARGLGGTGSDAAQGIAWEPYAFDRLSNYTGLSPDQQGNLQLILTQEESTGSLWETLGWLGAAFLAGLILNVMPCVLPVIGIKIMSFVQQAGEDRKTAFMLNVWFSLGLLSVFAILGVLATVAGLGWGAQFQHPAFIIVMTGIVFAFALSLLGVWEVPIPGFVGSSKANELADREGPSGAFAKGVLTTLLATPCTGPLLIPALAWAAKQSSLVSFGTFLIVGLGMASPYLFLGANPQLAKKVLPKPGAWMETFKQFMGFMLLATVVWLMFSLEFTKLLPMVATLFGIWFGCWVVGKIHITANMGRKARAWGIALGCIAAVAFCSFQYLKSSQESKLTWATDQKISEVLTALSSGKGNDATLVALKQRPPGRYTVLVDFTADWCATCKTNEATAIDTYATRKKLDELNIVTIKADKTLKNEAIDKLLRELGNKTAAIPFVAVFPADDPTHPIVQDGLLTQSRLLEMLEQAGPSKIGTAPNKATETAMRNP